MPYAANTKVPVDRSVAELRKLVTRFGAEAFGWAEESSPPRAAIMFRVEGRACRVFVPYPDDGDEREICRLWRVLVLVTKAKLTAVEEGLASFDRTFFADLLLPTGRVVYEEVRPQLEALAPGDVPKLLPETSS